MADICTILKFKKFFIKIHQPFKGCLELVDSRFVRFHKTHTTNKMNSSKNITKVKYIYRLKVGV